MVRLAADSVEDFLAKAAKKWGKGRTGATVVTPGFATGSFEDGQVPKLPFSLDSSSDHAETGGGTPDANGKTATKIVVEVAKEHEDRHASFCRDALDTRKPRNQAEQLMGTRFDSKAKAVKAAEAKLAELKAAMRDACVHARKRDGFVRIETKDDGSYDVITKPEGAAGGK